MVYMVIVVGIYGIYASNLEWWNGVVGRLVLRIGFTKILSYLTPVD